MWMPASTLSPRASSIAQDNKSHAITITTWVTLAVLVVVFLARQATRFAVVRKFAIDDIFILLATIFAIGLSATSFILASDGLGVFADLTLKRANALMKAYYASNILYILTIGSTKLSLVNFFYSDRTQARQRRCILGFGIFVLAWTLISVIAVAFQCGLPRPWEILTLHCYNSGAFWIVYCIIDMTTDVSIIMLSVNLVAYSKISLSKKFAVVGCFAPRVLVIGASLARLVYLYPITPHDNPAFALWIPTTCTQVQVCLAVVTACLPYMRPLLVAKDSNRWRGAGAKRKNGGLSEVSSYGCCSFSRIKAHKRGHGSSADSSAFTVSKTGRALDISPRIPTPRALSPLTPPRLRTPLSSSAGSIRRPSSSGLRLEIPPPEIHVRRASQVGIISPQTASSHALSPECLSAQALLSPPQAYPPTFLGNGTPSPPPPSHNPQTSASGSRRSLESAANLATSPPRFSLFPQTRTPRYSRLPQQHPNAALSVISERSRSRSGHRSSSQGMSPSSTPETRTPSPNTLPISPPTKSTPRFSRVLYDDPLRTKAAALSTSTPEHLSSNLRATSPYPPSDERHGSIPSYYIATPPTAHTSARSSPQTLPSYYMGTPPSSHPPKFPLPTPPSPTEPGDSATPPVPTSPQRQRNRRVLTPQNSSRAFDGSSSPPTPPSIWQEDVGGAARREEARRRENVRVKDVRRSPRIVVQQSS